MDNEKRVETNSVKAWLLAARPKTLTGALAPVMVDVVGLRYHRYHNTIFLAYWTEATLCYQSQEEGCD